MYQSKGKEINVNCHQPTNTSAPQYPIEYATLENQFVVLDSEDDLFLFDMQERMRDTP